MAKIFMNWLFTITHRDFEKLKKSPDFTVIGHAVDLEQGNFMVLRGSKWIGSNYSTRLMLFEEINFNIMKTDMFTFYFTNWLFLLFIDYFVKHYIKKLLLLGFVLFFREFCNCCTYLSCWIFCKTFRVNQFFHIDWNIIFLNHRFFKKSFR